MRLKLKKISVVVPMYLEEAVAKICYNRLVQVLNELKKYEYEIIFVNDGDRKSVV